MALLKNPETSWERPDTVQTLEPLEIEKRLGRVREPLKVLPGGLANANILISRDRVLRIYRRDPKSLAKETTLLKHKWERLRTPQVLAQGADFLLLEYVPHSPLEDSAEQGAALGSALAEIHGRIFEKTGFLGPELQPTETFPGFTAMMETHLTYLGQRAADFSSLISSIQDLFLAKEALLNDLADPPVLLHADFKVSNLFWTTAEKPLVLDWEFAYAGSALMDIGQLFRWDHPGNFSDAFQAAYTDAGGRLPKDWKYWAGVFDLGNLAGLLENTKPGSRRARDISDKIGAVLKAAG